MEKRDVIHLFGERAPTGSRQMNAADILSEAGETFRQRHSVYGNNFVKVGPIFASLFPKGITLISAEDFIRFEMIMMKVVKLSRYCENFVTGGHVDSIHDDMVYSAMLEFIDEVLNRGMTFVPEEPK